MNIQIPEELVPALKAIQAAGGKPLVVGGAVRDALLGNPRPKDIDVEVYGLTIRQLSDALKPLGKVDWVGAAFGVVKVHGLDADFSVPRRDNRYGAGHRAFQVEVDPGMSIEDAARRRDLTINSMAWDPFTGELHDPFRGVLDIEDRLLRATDPAKFLEDPLRAMRVAQFVSRLGFHVAPNLEAMCVEADLASLSGERLYEEWRKLLLGQHSYKAMLFVRGTMLRHFPELAAMANCPQDKEWHPEGCVYTHTALATERARELTDDTTVLFATLLHDAGKPTTTTNDDDGRVRSKGHEDAGVAPSRSFLQRLRAPKDLEDRVAALVAHHLAPAHFVPDAAHRHKRGDAGPSAYRRLARKLGDGGTDLKTLYLVSKADHLGRTTPDALARKFPSGEKFLRRATTVRVEEKPEPDVVMGRHLIERGYKPGPEIGRILAQCREVQYETGLRDPEAILSEVLK